MTVDAIERVVSAFNARDAEAFAAAFAVDGVLVDYPDTRAGEGRIGIFAYMSKFFEAYPNASVELVGRIDLGTRQITHERFDPGNGSPHYDAGLVYQLRDNEIIQMDFVRERRESDG